MDQKKKETPILLYHGTNDRVVPLEFAKFTHDKILRPLGIEYQLEVEAGLRHKVSPKEIMRLKEFVWKNSNHEAKIYQ